MALILVDCRETRGDAPLLREIQKRLPAANAAIIVKQALLNNCGDIMVGRLMPTLPGADTAVTEWLDENVRIDSKPLSAALPTDPTTTQTFQLVHVYERKTLPDLAGSRVRDSFVPVEQHLSKQEMDLKLVGEITGARPLFIVEGLGDAYQVDQATRSLPLKSIHSLIHRRTHKKGLCFVHSKDTRWTAEWIIKDAEMLLDDPTVQPNGWTRLGTGDDDRVDLAIKKTKTPAAWYQTALVAMKGVTDVVSRNIVREYPRLPDLMAAASACRTNKERGQLLEHMGGGKNKITAVSKRVCEALLGELGAEPSVKKQKK